MSLGGDSLEQKIKVSVIDTANSKETMISISRGDNLFDALVNSKLIISGECGGMGTCGKCIIRLVEGVLEITEQDKETLSSSWLREGYRLACTAYPDTDCTIILSSGIDNECKVVTEILSNLTDKDSSMKATIISSEELTNKNMAYAIALDLGTTTLAIALVGLPEGDILDNHTAINPQKVYGTDVISRIKASHEGKQYILSRLIREELLKGIAMLVSRKRISFADIKQIIIAGNTTMIHLFMEYPCGSLGTFPFTPYQHGTINVQTDEVFDIDERIPIRLLPGISAFVGGDIIAGLLACGIEHKDKPILFIDLGTNGEMALGNREKILVTSTAAGPAFEGGNISCGVASIPGAICHVSCKEGQLSYETIDEKPAVGLCGTGVIELVSVLINEGIIDSSGLLAEQYFEDGYPIAGMKLIQKDIRELQLAKAAIRAGVEILIKTYGIPMEQIDRVYIAGGFGYHMDIDKAASIGLLPQVLVDRTQAVGNTSLLGAICALSNSDANNRIEHIISISEEIYLSNVGEFNDLFVSYMSF